MRPEAIFAPVIVLVLWTLAIALLAAVRRVRAVRNGRIPVTAFRLGECAEVPDDVSLPNRNMMNLLEMPMLFYVACISIYATKTVEVGLMVLACAFVALRIVHSLIHVTTNRVIHRLIPFGLSNFVLLGMWAWFAVAVIAIHST